MNNIKTILVLTSIFLILVFSACKTDNGSPSVPKLLRIEITKMPDKTNYFAAQELNLTGMAVTAFYSNDTKKMVSGYTVSSIDPETMGSQEIIVSYEGKNAIFLIEVLVPSVTGIEITKNPNKIVYFTGQEIDLSGLIVSALYNDGSKYAVTGYTLSGYDPDTSGQQNITVSYEGQNTQFSVEVIVPSVTGIEIKKNPNKIIYLIGQELDLDGLIVTAFCNDGSVYGVTGYTISGFNSDTPGRQEITLSYKDNDALFTVNVLSEFPYLDMALIPAGDFSMGSPNNEMSRSSNEGPQHTVTLSSFYIGKYEVTQQEYTELTGNNPSYFSSYPPVSGEIPEMQPVENISWYDAIEFCNALSVLEGFTPAYIIDKIDPEPNIWGVYKWEVQLNPDSNGYRLPTEAQWEYACRAGTATAFYNGNNYAGSLYNNTLIGEVAWTGENANFNTHQTGLKQPNAWGLYDMHGNVQEWCWDWPREYSGDDQLDPQGASSGTERILRGGSAFLDPYTGFLGIGRDLRSAARRTNYEYYRSREIGFRVVRPCK